MNERVLVLVAHPDDESFFCGGRLVQHVHAGDSVTVVCYTDGVRSRPTATEDEVVTRWQQFHVACRVLGAHGLALRVFEDQRSDGVPQLTINQAVAANVASFPPTVVYTHHVGDLNLDHRRVAEAVLVAARGQSFRLFSLAPEWPALCVGPSWVPTENVTIEAEMDTKIRACACYMAETRDYPHPRSVQALRESGAESFLRIQ